MSPTVITADTVHDWERVMDDFAQQEPTAAFRGLVAEWHPHRRVWWGTPAYQWPDESPWLGINRDGTRRTLRYEP